VVYTQNKQSALKTPLWCLKIELWFFGDYLDYNLRKEGRPDPPGSQLKMGLFSF